MKSVLLSLILGLGVAMTGVSMSANADTSTATHKTKKKTMQKRKGVKAAKQVSKNGHAKAAAKEKLSTDVKFSDNTLHGQYQTPDEALANVEGEKGLNDLIGVRKHFKDRLAETAEQE